MLNYKLSDIQNSTIDRIKQMSACVIALSPGTGKTLTILHFVKHFLLKDKNDKCLFFIPKSARAAFEKEMTTRIKDKYILIHAGKQYEYKDIEKYKYIFIESTLINKYIETLVGIASTYNCHLIIDEAHSLQNPTSVFCKAAWEIRCYCKRVYAMTATPLMNSIDGLFNLMHFVFPRLFNSWIKFRSRYCITQERTIRIRGRNGQQIQRKFTDIIGYKNLEELNDTLDKLIIKGSVHYNVNFEFLECPLDEQSEKLYKYASNGLFDIVYHPEKVKQKSKVTSDNVLDNTKDFGSRLHDLQRIVDYSDNAVYEKNKEFVSNKMKLLLDTTKSIIDKNESVLIYFEYIESLELAEKLLLLNKEKIGFNNIYRLTGAEKEEHRSKIEANLGLKEIVLCSQAASQSRNLQRANNIICFHCPFSVGRTVQVLGRICRMDSIFDHQNVYFISVSDTIDTYKTALFKKHLNLINALLGKEAIGTLENCTCQYLDVDLNDIKELKKTQLWRK